MNVIVCILKVCRNHIHHFLDVSFPIFFLFNETMIYCTTKFDIEMAFSISANKYIFLY